MKNKINVLRLSSYYFPEQISSSHLTNDLEDAYIKNNIHSVRYVPTPTRGIDEETYQKYKKIKYEEFRDGFIKVHRFSMFREGKNPIGRAIRYILVNIIQYFKGCGAKNIDIVLAGSTPPTQGLLCGWVAKRLSKKYKRKVPFVYNLQDIFPDSLVHTGLTKKGSILWKIGRVVENITYKNADKIIVISEGFKKNIMAKGVPEEKIVVIPNWVDENTVVSVKKEENPLFDKYNLDRNKFYVCYSGNIGFTQNMEELCSAAKKLEKSENIGIIIVGDGAFKPQLEKIIAERKIKNITLIPFQDYSEISNVFSLGDVGLIISKSGVGTNSVPSKTWSIMSAERPVLACFDNDSDLCDIVRDTGCGVCVEPDDIDGLVNAIITLSKNSEENIKMGKKGREYILKYLTKEIGTSKYVEVLKQAVKN